MVVRAAILTYGKPRLLLMEEQSSAGPTEQRERALPVRRAGWSRVAPSSAPGLRAIPMAVWRAALLETPAVAVRMPIQGLLLQTGMIKMPEGEAVQMVVRVAPEGIHGIAI